MNQQNEFVTREGMFHQASDLSLTATYQPLPPEPPQTSVYVIDKKDFKSIVKQLTTSPSCEASSSSSQNVSKRQRLGKTVQEDPGASKYMDFVNTCVNIDHVPTQAPLQSQVVTQPMPYPNPLNQTMPYSNALNQSMPYPNGLNQSMPYPNGLNQTMPYPNALNQTMPYPNGHEQVMSTTYPSSQLVNDSYQQMNDAYSFQPTSVQNPQPLPPNSTFSSMYHPGFFGPGHQHP